MPYSFGFIVLCSLLCVSATIAKTPLLKPKAFILPVTKDPKTLQYLSHIKQRTPLVTLSLTVDLGGRSLWTNCQTGYVSSTHRFYSCKTSECKRVSTRNTFCNTCASSTHGPGCNNNSCSDLPVNPIGLVAEPAELTSDVVSVQSTNGNNPTGLVTIPNFLFYCSDNRAGVLRDLAKGVTGIAGLGRTPLSIPTQFASFFNYPNIFAICLSPSSKGKGGVIFLGDGPYYFLPNAKVASSLSYTPLLVNLGRLDANKPDPDYYIRVTSIKINGQVVPINTRLLSLKRADEGGTLISSVNPYTVLRSSIYDAFVKAFDKAMSNSVTRVTPVAPFDACYSSKKIGSTRLGPAVPVIDFVLQSEKVYWRINGANSMVRVTKDVMCLGFVRQDPFAGVAPPIMIGGHQLENNLLQFNVAKSTLGFSSSLLSRQTTCANFNFTATA